MGTGAAILSFDFSYFVAHAVITTSPHDITTEGASTNLGWDAHHSACCDPRRCFISASILLALLAMIFSAGTP